MRNQAKRPSCPLLPSPLEVLRTVSRPRSQLFGSEFVSLTLDVFAVLVWGRGFQGLCATALHLVLVDVRSKMQPVPGLQAESARGWCRALPGPGTKAPQKCRRSGGASCRASQKLSMSWLGEVHVANACLFKRTIDSLTS